MQRRVVENSPILSFPRGEEKWKKLIEGYDIQNEVF